jgi:putative membrane protein
MKKLFTLLLPVALITGCAHDPQNQGAPETGSASVSGTAASQLSSTDMHFIKAASQGGIAEVKMGYMGVQSGTSQEVKNLGQKLIQDHTAANKELEQLAARKGVALTGDIDSKHQKELDTLSKLNGAEFDKAYLHHAVMDHQKDIKQYQAAADKATDQDIRAFAQRTIPILQQHLDMAKNAQNMTTTGATTSGSTSSQ